MHLSLVLLPFLPRVELFLLLALGILSGKKLALLQCLFSFSMALLTFKALLLSVIFLSFISHVFSGAHITVGALSLTLSHLEYLFNLVSPLKVQWVVQVLCHFEGWVWLTEATFMLGIGALLLMNLERQETTASKSFSHLSWCTPIVGTAVDNLSP